MDYPAALKDSLSSGCAITFPDIYYQGSVLRCALGSGDSKLQTAAVRACILFGLNRKGNLGGYNNAAERLVDYYE